MKPENMTAIARMIVREVALGLTDEDVAVNHPEYTAAQIARMRAGATFKRALAEIQTKIDAELVAHAAEDPVRQYLHSKGLDMAKTLVSVATDKELSESARVKAANSVLDRIGYGGKQEDKVVPILMLSPEKLASVLAKPDVLSSVPDCVDGPPS